MIQSTTICSSNNAKCIISAFDLAATQCYTLLLYYAATLQPTARYCYTLWFLHMSIPDPPFPPPLSVLRSDHCASLLSLKASQSCIILSHEFNWGTATHLISNCILYFLCILHSVYSVFHVFCILCILHYMYSVYSVSCVFFILWFLLAVYSVFRVICILYSVYSVFCILCISAFCVFYILCMYSVYSVSCVFIIMWILLDVYSVFCVIECTFCIAHLEALLLWWLLSPSPPNSLIEVCSQLSDQTGEGGTMGGGSIIRDSIPHECWICYIFSKLCINTILPNMEKITTSYKIQSKFENKGYI